MKVTTRQVDFDFELLQCQNCQRVFKVRKSLQIKVWREIVNNILQWYDTQVDCCKKPNISWICNEKYEIIEMEE